MSGPSKKSSPSRHELDNLFLRVKRLRQDAEPSKAPRILARRSGVDLQRTTRIARTRHASRTARDS
jgi:hypothetical protein